MEYWNKQFIPIEALMEMVADWFAASLAYSSTWPINGHWEWVQHHLATKEEEIHPVSFQFICGILVVLGYERSVMAALSINHPHASKFDWEAACSIVNELQPSQGENFRELFEIASV